MPAKLINKKRVTIMDSSRLAAEEIASRLRQGINLIKDSMEKLEALHYEVTLIFPERIMTSIQQGPECITFVSKTERIEI